MSQPERLILTSANLHLLYRTRTVSSIDSQSVRDNNQCKAHYDQVLLYHHRSLKTYLITQWIWEWQCFKIYQRCPTLDDMFIFQQTCLSYSSQVSAAAPNNLLISKILPNIHVLHYTAVWKFFTQLLRLHIKHILDVIDLFSISMWCLEQHPAISNQCHHYRHSLFHGMNTIHSVSDVSWSYFELWPPWNKINTASSYY